MKKLLSLWVSLVLAITTVGLASVPARADGCASPMRLTYDLSLLGGGLQIVIPLGAIANPIAINWGDGQTETAYSLGTYSHDYSSSGTYEVQLCGELNTFGRASSTPVTGAAALTAVSSFGDLPLTSLQHAFSGATNLTDVPAVIPATVTNLTGTFRGATAFNDPDVSTWNTTSVTSFSNMFQNASAFNQNVGVWDTSSLTTMTDMFNGATAFNNAGSSSINDWDISSVTNLSNVFKSAAAFNQNVGDWDTSNVTSMMALFMDAFAFNNGGSDTIKNWNVGKVTDFLYTFRRTAFNQPIGSWNIGENISTPVIKMLGMFESADAFNQPIGDWDVSDVYDFSNMFARANGSWPAMNFNQNIGAWDITNGLNFTNMFFNSTAFNNGGSDDIADWGPFRVNANLDYMFHLTILNQPIGAWDVSNVKSMRNFLYFNTAFDQDLSSWDISSIVTTGGYAPGAEGGWSGNLTSAFDWSGWSTRNYDAFLIAQASRADSPGFASGLALGANGIQYSCNATSARAALITAGMVITDGGLAAVPYPTLLTATPGAGSIDLTWSTPACESVPVTPIKYQVSTNNGDTWMDATAENSITVSGLTGGQSYSLRVRVVTADGTSPASNLLTATPLAAPDAELFVVADNQVIESGSTAPGADFYTYTLHEDSASGPVVSPTLTSQPVCTSSYNSSMTAATSPLSITCSGASAEGYSVSYVSGVLTIVDPAPEVEFAPKFTVRYNANGATTGALPIPAALVTSGLAYTVLNNIGNLAKTGYSFGGWTDGVKVYQPGDSFVVNANTTLAAVWISNPAAVVGTYTPRKINQTSFTWDAINGAQEYRVTVNGRVVYTGTATSFTHDKLVGPASKVRVKVTTGVGIMVHSLSYKPGKKIFGTVVRFAEKSFAISGKSAKRLSALATLIRWQGFKNLLVIGYTESQSGSENATWLSRARAKAVANYLRARGVNAAIAISGETAAANLTTSAAQNAKARRALLWLIP